MPSDGGMLAHTLHGCRKAILHLADCWDGHNKFICRMAGKRKLEFELTGHFGICRHRAMVADANRAIRLGKPFTLIADADGVMHDLFGRLPDGATYG